MSDHIETIDSSLENLQNVLNSQSFTFDASPLMEVRGRGRALSNADARANVPNPFLCVQFFNTPADFDIGALDTVSVSDRRQNSSPPPA